MNRKFNSISELIGAAFHAMEAGMKRRPSNRELWAYICSAFTMNNQEYIELCESLSINEPRR